MARARLSPTMVRLVVAVFVLQIASSVAAIAFLRTQMLDVVGADRVRQVIDVRDDLLAAFYDGGREELDDFVAQRRGRSADPLVFVAVTGRNPPLLGNVLTVPHIATPNRIVHVSIVRGRQQPLHGGIALATDLSDGTQLVVGALTDRERRLDLAFAEAIGLTILVAVAFAMASALFLGVTISRRTHAIAETAAALASGDFAARVPVEQTGDGFDHLRLQMNQMAERIDQLVAQLRSVSGALAHDLQSPVARLTASIDTALAKAQDHAAIEALQAARMDADALRAMLATALDISRLEGGTVADRRRPIDLAETAADLVDLYEPLAEQSGATLAGTFAPVTVLADRELVSRAIANVIDNALKYGGRDISVTTRAVPGWGEVAISDNGPGIAQEDRARAVERFTRLDNARTRPGGGLGLAMVAAVAKLHGGSFELSGEDGLVATLRLPRI
ncbi:sensor histidine kinase [Novosphingobium lentum]|uniref:sensor histidine kinase n=1 Tax=Novosphingobium lentum TaxID=145287 RepID=UPI000A925E88|nr:HAMP domain-containing sensor histidine kinase [Novosphingobium lentum]